MKENLHYILEEDGRSVTVENGVVTATSTPTPLPNTPKGWQDIVINLERNLTWFGVIRSFTTPLAYVLKAAQIIRHTVYTQNIERKLLHLIQKLTSEVTSLTYRLVYRYLYRGEIDLSTFKDEDSYVTCAIMEGGLSKKLNANKDTVYELRMAEDPDIKYLFLDGVLIKSLVSFLTIQQYQNASSLGGLPYNTLWLSVQFIGSEGTLVNGAGFSTQPLVESNSASSHDDAGNTDNYFFEATADLSLNFSQNITAILANGISMELYIKNSNGTRTQLLMLVADNPSGTVPATKTETFFIDVDIPVATGERLYLISELRDSPFIAGAAIGAYEEFQFVFNFDSTYRATTIRFYLPETAGKKLTAKFTGSEDDFESTLLQSKANYGLTCGDAIRGIDAAKIKTSLSEFFADYNVTCFAGLSVDNGKIRMESRPIYFDESNPVDLGAAKDLEVTLALDIMGNTIKAGHTKPDIEDVNGKFDPNGSSVYTTPITKIAKEINLVGPYKKGPYEIEITRINLDGKVTTDNNNDNDSFVIDVKEVPPVTTTVSFQAETGLMVIPNGIVVSRGMRIAITGSVSNDGEYVVEDVASIVVAQVVSLGRAVIDEVNVTVTIVFPYILNREPIVDNDIDVCPSPETIFNVRFTPKNILKLHGRWLRSLLYGFDSDKIKFQSGDKNTKFLAEVDGVTIDEDADENIYSLGALLFKPFYFDFTTEVPSDLVAILEAGLNRCFSFTWDGNTYKGFLIKASQAVNTEQEQKFRLLSAPSNNLLTLVV